jgi:hypothetical protein
MREGLEKAGLKMTLRMEVGVRTAASSSSSSSSRPNTLFYFVACTLTDVHVLVVLLLPGATARSCRATRGR